MYQNHIRRTTPKITPNSHPQFFIRRSDIAFDPRVAYVESVCASLAESRFGPGRAEPVVIDLSGCPEFDPALFCDLCDDVELLSDYDLEHLSFLGRIRQMACPCSDKFSGTHVSEPGAVATGFLNRNSLGRAGPPRCGLSGTAFLGRGSP